MKTLKRLVVSGIVAAFLSAAVIGLMYLDSLDAARPFFMMPGVPFTFLLVAILPEKNVEYWTPGVGDIELGRMIMLGTFLGWFVIFFVACLVAQEISLARSKDPTVRGTANGKSDPT